MSVQGNASYPMILLPRCYPESVSQRVANGAQNSQQALKNMSPGDELGFVLRMHAEGMIELSGFDTETGTLRRVSEVC